MGVGTNSDEEGTNSVAFAKVLTAKSLGLQIANRQITNHKKNWVRKSNFATAITEEDTMIPVYRVYAEQRFSCKLGRNYLLISYRTPLNLMKIIFRNFLVMVFNFSTYCKFLL